MSWALVRTVFLSRMTLMVSMASLALEIFGTEAAVVSVSIANSEPHRCCTMASRFSAWAWTVFWRQMMLKVSMASLEFQIFDTVAVELLPSVVLEFLGTLVAVLVDSFVSEVFDIVAVVLAASTRPAPHCPPQSTTSS